ncbi:hypothetical protein AVEN_241651-1 [Araneus ventricosus]|uniref:CCHC-type domain-containing protein n=1 Tax=Araneus ventricosus TaxID=182803 RepID=A0A4Y2TWW9_ARAVE|nr:hypothetical protein AVEN_241651-1 [Araneus ventricosus]
MAEFKSPELLSEKLYQYESVRNMMKRKTTSHDHKEKYSSFKENNSAHIRSATKEVDEGFEQKKEYRCNHCSSTRHFRSNCPQLKQSESTAFLNWIISVPDNDLISPYTVIGEVNGFKMLILRDTGTTADIVPRNRMRPEMIIGEHIWVQQTFDEKPICLPLAEVELKGKFGQLKTKAAVVEADKGNANKLNDSAQKKSNTDSSKKEISYESHLSSVNRENGESLIEVRIEQEDTDELMQLKKEDLPSEVETEPHSVVSNVEDTRRKSLNSQMAESFATENIGRKYEAMDTSEIISNENGETKDEPNVAVDNFSLSHELHGPESLPNYGESSH